MAKRSYSSIVLTLLLVAPARLLAQTPSNIQPYTPGVTQPAAASQPAGSPQPAGAAPPAAFPYAPPPAEPPIPPHAEGQPLVAPGGDYCFFGSHPADARVAIEGPWHDAHGSHTHPYAPFDLRLFAYRDGCYHFVGDPMDFGYAGSVYSYYGAHPVLDIYGGGWCFMIGGHRHSWRPWSTNFVVVGSWYYWDGPYDAFFWSYWPYYSFYYRAHYGHHYGGGRFYRSRTVTPAPPIGRVPTPAPPTSARLAPAAAAPMGNGTRAPSWNGSAAADWGGRSAGTPDPSAGHWGHGYGSDPGWRAAPTATPGATYGGPVGPGSTPPLEQQWRGRSDLVGPGAEGWGSVRGGGWGGGSAGGAMRAPVPVTPSTSAPAMPRGSIFGGGGGGRGSSVMPATGSARGWRK